MKALVNEKLEINGRLEEPSQKMLEVHEETLMAIAEGTKSAAKFNSAIVRGASASGILTGVDVKDVDDWKPAKTKWLSAEIVAFINECNKIPLG